MNNVVLMLGGNVGDTRQFFKIAISKVEEKIGKVNAQSSLYATSAWGFENQPDFLNQAIIVETELAPETLLHSIHGIEETIGKNTPFKNGPRTIDIDVMFYNDLVLNNPELTIPHPRLHLRRFNLEPLAEIIPEFSHPVLHLNIASLLLKSDDQLPVKKLKGN